MFLSFLLRNSIILIAEFSGFFIFCGDFPEISPSVSGVSCAGITPGESIILSRLYLIQ